MVVQEDSKLRGLRQAIYVCSGICIIATAIIMAVKLIWLNSFYDYYYYGYKDTERAWIISIGVISILTQFLGIYTASKQSYKTSLTYSIICSLLAGVTVAYAVLYYMLAFILVVALFACGSVASVYAKHIRALKKRALNTNVAVYSGQQNIMFQMPFNGQQTNYPMHNGGQPSYIVSGQPGQMHITGALPNSVGPYQSQPYGYPQAPTNPSYTEPALQPPSYSQSQVPVIPDASGSTFSAPDAQNIAGTVTQHKTMPAAPGWHT